MPFTLTEPLPSDLGVSSELAESAARPIPEPGPAAVCDHRSVFRPCTDLLVPRDVLHPREPDGHFAAEAQAAHRLGLRVQLIDHDAVVAGDFARGLRGVVEAAFAVYRGWMVTPTTYEALAGELARRSVRLRTPPDAFGRAHHLPGWYAEMSALTPRSVWTIGGDFDGLVAAAAELGSGPAVLKDHSKSEKHYWHEAMFVPDLADTEHLLAVARRFLELRGAWFDGGFVLRRYEEFAPGEWRTWWVGGRCVSVTAHPDTPDTVPVSDGVGSIAGAIDALGLPFVSVDLARSAATGELRIVEVGDGQVSDRPSTADADRFVAAITGVVA